MFAHTSTRQTPEMRKLMKVIRAQECTGCNRELLAFLCVRRARRPAPGSSTTGQSMQHRRCAAHATHTLQHRCSCMHKAHTRPNLPRGRPSRAFCELTTSALFCAVARAGSAHLATRARRAHFDRSRGGRTHVLCSAASSAAMRCVRAEFGALACHPAISRYSAGARRGEGHCRACRAPGGLGSCVRAHRRTLHGRTWLPAR